MCADPQELGGGKTGKGDVAGQGGKPVLPYFPVEPGGLLDGPTIIPENGRLDYLILPVQEDQTVHLPAEADAVHRGGVEPFQKGSAPAQVWDHQSSGDCSDQPFRGNERGYLRCTVRSTRPLCSISSSLTAEVPKSIPIYSIVCSPFSMSAAARALQSRTG